jgi:hypothetical protein
MNKQKALFEKLRQYLDIERCKACECLQAALIQIELDADSETAALAKAHRTPIIKTHS